MSHLSDILTNMYAFEVYYENGGWDGKLWHWNIESKLFIPNQA